MRLPSAVTSSFNKPCMFNSFSLDPLDPDHQKTGCFVDEEKSLSHQPSLADMIKINEENEVIYESMETDVTALRSAKPSIDITASGSLGSDLPQHAIDAFFDLH